MESILSTVIIGLLLVAALSVLGATARTKHVRSAQHHGETLAHGLLSEILQSAYEEPDDPPLFGRENFESVGNRIKWDDVDDYAGWSRSPPKDKENNVFDHYGHWRREVSVKWVTVSDPNTTSLTETGLKRINVIVTDPLGKRTVLTALRAAAGLNENPQNDLVCMSWIGIELQVGADLSARVAGGSDLINQAPVVGQNLLKNPGLEAGSTTGWSAAYGGSIDARTINPHSGSYYLRMYNRSSYFHGPGQWVTTKIRNGATYNCSAWVHGSSPNEQFKFVLYLDSTGEGPRSLFDGFEWITTSWQRIDGTFTPTWTGTLKAAYVKVSSEAPDTSLFYIDDVSFSEAP